MKILKESWKEKRKDKTRRDEARREEKIEKDVMWDLRKYYIYIFYMYLYIHYVYTERERECVCVCEKKSEWRLIGNDTLRVRSWCAQFAAWTLPHSSFFPLVLSVLSSCMCCQPTRETRTRANLFLYLRHLDLVCACLVDESVFCWWIEFFDNTSIGVFPPSHSFLMLW